MTTPGRGCGDRHTEREARRDAAGSGSACGNGIRSRTAALFAAGMLAFPLFLCAGSGRTCPEADSSRTVLRAAGPHAFSLSGTSVRGLLTRSSARTGTPHRSASAAVSPHPAPVEEEPVSRPRRRLVHGLGVEYRPSYILPTNDFLRGDNLYRQSIRYSASFHLRYAFGFRPGSQTDRIYGGVYQGVGLSGYLFPDREEIGSPLALYLFQGARIARVAPWLTLNYEWNFGLSTGWKSYDREYNPNNKMMGSEMNAYIDVNVYFSWRLSRLLDLNAGLDMTHFSNGNTWVPNAGLNTVGLKTGLTAWFNRRERFVSRLSRPRTEHPFPRHVSYDLTVFGSWRRKGVDYYGEGQIASPKAYPVVGFNFSPMYNLSYKLRLGISLDGVYDTSANVYLEDQIVAVGETPDLVFRRPEASRQLALGLSGRAEYVMPYCTVGLGIGSNVLHGQGDLDALYQMLYLKINTTRSTYLHIGYSLQNFQDPNFLMLGVGFRLHNRYPRLR